MKSRRVHPGDFVLSNSMSFGRPFISKIEGCIHDGWLAISEFDGSLEPNFLYHLLGSPRIQEEFSRRAGVGAVQNLNADIVKAIAIPCPPIEVQRAIVEVLDLFGSLNTEIQAELEARRLQYAYYRDSMFGFTSAADVSRRPLGDLGQFIRGRRFTKDDVVESGIPSIHYGEIYTHYGVATESVISHVRTDLVDQLRYAQPGDVVFAAVGETVEDVAKAVAWLGDEPVAIHDDTFLFRSELNSKYVSYFAQTGDFHRQKHKHVARAKVNRISGEGLSKIAIPVPSLGQQERIVDILDKLNALVSDPSGGLPAEIVARRTQYEHYRDRLLTFEELVV
ncbi:type I restriction enzyme, S subunit [Mycobacterium sp. 283mftsu]|nr:type I restriction enzyme, S subunit [Mycobacterium sp. 283mftsu]